VNASRKRCDCGVHLGALDERLPARVAGQLGRPRKPVDLDRPDRCLRRVVALEECGVDDDAAHTGHAQSHDHFVVTGFAPAAGLPPVVAPPLMAPNDAGGRSPGPD
jgi:hypothetical protein